MATPSERSAMEAAFFEEDVDDTSDDTGGADASSSIDADMQMEAVELSLMGTTTQKINENEKPKKLTMQLIRQSMRTAIKHQSMRRRLHGQEEEEEEEDEEPQHSPTSTAQEQDGGDQDDEIDALLQKKVLRLDWMNVAKMENLEAFTHIHELYLQHNLIPKIENLNDHSELIFLALAGNRIEKVENLKHLTKLKFLDLSNNRIDDFDIREFPSSLVILRLAGNPFLRHMPAYMHLFFEKLPHLVQIDQFRRLPGHLNDDKVASPRSATPPLGLSPRSAFVELEMEVERGSHHKPVALSSPAEDGGGGSVFDFSMGDYEKQKAERMAQWKQQLHDLETRQVELESEIPMLSRPTSEPRRTTRRSKKQQNVVDKAREGTQAVIAQSIAHFQQMELEHTEWREQLQQHQAA